jgi:hypothetical protein
MLYAVLHPSHRLPILRDKAKKQIAQGTLVETLWEHRPPQHKAWDFLEPSLLQLISEALGIWQLWVAEALSWPF